MVSPAWLDSPYVCLCSILMPHGIKHNAADELLDGQYGLFVLCGQAKYVFSDKSEDETGAERFLDFLRK